MRYINWDVLLFPGNSRIPMQEYKTACYVVHDSEMLHEDLGSGRGGVVRQVPIVACFLANQKDTTPFKVSIHSWSLPNLSRDLQQVETLGNEKLGCFEARVIVDGICVGSTIMMLTDVFPKIIDHSFQVDKNGHRDLLRWPAFHQEMLTQSYWNAGENIGRIKVTIAEGFVHTRHESPFMRTKNLVTFSFQHAPQPVLESSGIAWPNKGMWMPPPQPLYNATPASKSQEPLDPELHAHSPTRANSERQYPDRSRLSSAQSNIGIPMGPPPLPGFNKMTNTSTWNRDPKMADPFVDHRACSKSASDQSMPDYSTTSESDKMSLSSAAFFANQIAPNYQAREQFEDLIHITDSPIHPSSGLAPPANTRTNSTDPMNTQLLIDEQGQQDLTQYQSVRQDSDTTMRTIGTDVSDRPMSNLNRSFYPAASSVKGKKEGNSPRRETPPVGSKQQYGSPAAEGHLSRNSSEGKRKRENQGARRVSMTDNLEIPSPRKVSKMDGEESVNTEGPRSRQTSGSTRQILGALSNV